jgi:hypothetical protein
MKPGAAWTTRTLKGDSSSLGVWGGEEGWGKGGQRDGGLDSPSSQPRPTAAHLSESDSACSAAFDAE